MKPDFALWLAAAALLPIPASAAPMPAAPDAVNDYAQPGNWLCLPGRDDACTTDLDSTIVQADGSTALEPFEATDDAPFDCFYVYPTVSTDEGGNSDRVIDDAERRVVQQQAARFASRCRVFAPMYRQVTLAGLRQVMSGQKTDADSALAYADVQQAWRWYLAQENQGRGVVLIGHSQGSRMLLELLARDIDGHAAQKQLIAALVIGMNVPVDDDDRFGTIPICRQAEQTGCIVSYVSFRDTRPPPPHSRFGKVDSTGRRAACVNPAALLAGQASGEPVALHAYLSSQAFSTGSSLPPEPFAHDLTVTTPFVSLPGLIRARCVETPEFNVLTVSVLADPEDPRTDDITGDVVIGGRILEDWGLHLIDVNLAMGDLLALVDRQARTYLQQ